jgi:hypothetical protein
MRHAALAVGIIALALVSLDAAAPPGAPPPATAPAEKDIPKLTEQLRIGFDARARVIKLLGQPTEYLWQGQTYDAKKLPPVYLMKYPGGVGVIVVRNVVTEIRFNEPGYQYLGKVGVGSTKDDVLAALGPPRETVKGQRIGWVDGVLYEDADGQAGFDYYARRDKKCRVFLRDGKVVEMSLGTSEILPAPKAAVKQPAKAATRPT